MPVSKLRHSYHCPRLTAWRILWPRWAMVQVSHESLMITSFPKCRKRTDQSRIIMQFRGAMYYNNFLKSKQKCHHRDFQGSHITIIYETVLTANVPFAYKFTFFSFFCPLPPFLFWCNRTEAASDTGDCAAKCSQARVEWSVKGFSLKFIRHSHPTLEINDQCLQYFNHGREEMH